MKRQTPNFKVVKDQYGHFSKEDTHMAHSTWKGVWHQLSEESKSKSREPSPLMPVMTAVIKSDKNKCWQGWRSWKPRRVLQGCKTVELHWKGLAVPQKVKQLLHGPAIPLPGRHQREIKTYVHTKIGPQMIKAALSITAKEVRSTQIPDDEWINQEWDIRTMELRSVTGRNKVLLNATLWTDLEYIMLSEIRRTQKDKYMISLIWDTKNRQIRRDRKYNKGDQGLGEERRGSYCFMGRASVCGDEVVLEMNTGDGYTTVKC